MDGKEYNTRFDKLDNQDGIFLSEEEKKVFQDVMKPIAGLSVISARNILIKVNQCLDSNSVVNNR